MSKKKKLTEVERLALIAEVYDLLYATSLTFEGPLGMQLAYLLGAIATDQQVSYSKRTVLFRALKANLKDSHQVFGYFISQES